MDALMIAHNLEAGESIFSKKISFAWEKLPAEIRQLYGVDNKTTKTLRFDFGEKGFSSLAVDTSGRSGTYQRVHVTELAEISKKYPKKVPDIIEGTIPAVPSNGRVDVESTSQGASGEFYEMFMEAWERGLPRNPQEYKAHFYNWTWDDEEINRITPISFKDMEQGEKFREYAERHKLPDVQITYYYLKWLSLNKKWNSLKREYPTTPQEAFDAVSEGTYFGEQVGLMEINGQIGLYPHQRELKVHTVWDLGIGKNLVVGFYQRDTVSNLVYKVDCLEGEGSDGIPQMIAKVLNKPYVYGKHFAPHDIKATEEGTGKTRLDTAKSLGINFTVIEDHSVEDRINQTSLFLDRLRMDAEKCKKCIRALKAYEHEWDEKRGMYKDEPLHNWASHWADETGYAAMVENKMNNNNQINLPFRDATNDWWDGGAKQIERYHG